MKKYRPAGSTKPGIPTLTILFENCEKGESYISRICAKCSETTYTFEEGAK